MPRGSQQWPLPLPPVCPFISLSCLLPQVYAYIKGVAKTQ